ncbi:tripartite motif-containing protein 3-like [Lingula anatina]|uniref:Tripartite motif-containing protein 3-like n=1 Tax=Lingula anatina TaxID=7574 RepID=A0A1S3IXP6_LINAN|nr:tripartite motif-containing protein 3-like [Lingula anatina]|eukprot:XP_013402803.1 tripartite motif-containing protein 3-like [Lingula anatina]
MARALAAAFTDNILTCSICLEEYQDPRMLPCYHTFCLVCISDHAKRTITRNRTFQCPVCREDVQFPAGGLSKFKKNFAFCKAKDIINQRQTEREASENVQTNVQAVTQTVAQLTNGCEKHPGNELKFYCEEDYTVVCGDCALADHYRHGILPVEKVAKSNRETIETNLVKTLAKVNVFKEAVAKETTIEYEDSLIRTATTNIIEKQAQLICTLINERKDALISEVNSAYDDRKKQSEASKDFLELHQASLQSACDFTQQLVGHGTDFDIMVHTKTLAERLISMENTPLPTPDSPAQISYSPGKISIAGLEAMLGQVTAPKLPVFLEKAECVHSFTAKLKYDKENVIIWGLATDEQYIYATGYRNDKTKVFTHAGQFMFDIKIKTPFDVAVSQTGHMYITSMGDRCVKVYSTKGKQVTTMGQGQLEQPSCITLNRQGHVMVFDVKKESILTFHAGSGHLLNTIRLTMCEYPTFITVNRANNNIVISDLGNCVHVLSPTGDQLYKYGTEGSGVGQLSGPSGVCTDSYGHIFIADGRNNRVVALSPQGQFIKYVATEDDGLKYPIALTINPAGLLVVAERRGIVKTFLYLQ